MGKQKFIHELNSKSFLDEIQNDIKMNQAFLDRYDKEEFTNQAEKTSNEIYKRFLLLAGACNLHITDPQGNSKPASENGLPLATYLSHGSRIKIEIPADSGDLAINWLTSGNEARVLPNVYQSKGPEEGGVYHRRGATHSVKINKNTSKELKGFRYGLGSAIASLAGVPSKHYGVDLALGIIDNTDLEGNSVKKITGDHGHLYIYYKPATKTKPGAILFGVEGSAPNSKKHSLLGKSDPYSAVGGSLWDKLREKLNVNTKKYLPNTILPKKYDGMSGKIDNGFIKYANEIYLSKLDSSLPEVIPGKNISELMHNIDNKKLYKQPELERNPYVQKSGNVLINIPIHQNYVPENSSEASNFFSQSNELLGQHPFTEKADPLLHFSKNESSNFMEQLRLKNNAPKKNLSPNQTELIEQAQKIKSNVKQFLQASDNNEKTSNISSQHNNKTNRKKVLRPSSNGW